MALSRGYSWLNLSVKIRNEARYFPSLLSPSVCRLSELAPSSHSKVNTSPELDKLYKTIEVEVRGHDPSVLKSYQYFVSMAAKNLDVNLHKTWDPKKVIERRTLLKSVFVHKKHMVQYEMRTHFKVFQFKHLTGSTADTFLEYIQRNLPEGVAMKVTKNSVERFRDHIKPPTS